MRLRGRWTLTRVCRRTGHVLGVRRGRNAIQTAGRNRVMDTTIGASALHLDQANADLVIRRESDEAIVATFTGADAGHPDHATSKQVTFQWTDDSTDSYDAFRLEVKRDHGGTDDLLFSQADPEFGTKPSGETWIYEYTLAIAKRAVDIQDAGLDLILRLLTGDSGDHFDNAGTVLDLFDAGDVHVGAVACDSGSPARAGDTVTWEFTSAPGSDSVEWDDLEVNRGAQGTTLNRSKEGLGTKRDLISRKYVFALMIL